MKSLRDNKKLEHWNEKGSTQRNALLGLVALIEHRPGDQSSITQSSREIHCPLAVGNVTMPT